MSLCVWWSCERVGAASEERWLLDIPYSHCCIPRVEVSCWSRSSAPEASDGCRACCVRGRL